MESAGPVVTLLVRRREGRHASRREELGIDEFHAEVLLAQKNDLVARLKSEGWIVAMAGDGINDAPALAAAQVGIAMGHALPWRSA